MDEVKLTDEEINRIAETLGQHIPGYCNFDSWGHGYKADAKGEFTVPLVPVNVIPFARAIEAKFSAEVEQLRRERDQLREALIQCRVAIVMQRDVIERGKHMAAWEPFVKQADVALSASQGEQGVSHEL